MPYYIISLKHTQKSEKFMTLWRPNNAGYCMAKDMAGIYEEPEKGYHDTEGQLPIRVEEASGLFILDTKYWGDPHYAIPNTKAVWGMLGVKWVKGDLVKI